MAELPERLKPRKEPSQDRARTLVEAIVQAAAQLLIERGWDGLTMKELAERAGVSPGSLYQYFPDRGSVVAAIIERQSERELAFMLERMSPLTSASSPLEAIEALLRGAVAFQTQEGPLMRATLRAMPHIGRHDLLVERVQTVALAFRGLLAPALPNASERALDEATHVLVNAIHSLTHDGALPRPAWFDDDALVRNALRLVRGYLSP